MTKQRFKKEICVMGVDYHFCFQVIKSASSLFWEKDITGTVTNADQAQALAKAISDFWDISLKPEQLLDQDSAGVAKLIMINYPHPERRRAYAHQS